MSMKMVDNPFKKAERAVVGKRAVNKLIRDRLVVSPGQAAKKPAVKKTTPGKKEKEFLGEAVSIPIIGQHEEKIKGLKAGDVALDARVDALEAIYNASTINIGVNGKYASISAALAAITDASAAKRYTLVLLENITEVAGLTWKSDICLNLNGFALTINSATSEAGIYLPPMAWAWLFGGNIVRSGSAIANTYTVSTNNNLGNAVRVFNCRIENQCAAAGCFAIDCFGDTSTMFYNLIPVIANDLATASIRVRNTALPSFQNCQIRGILCEDAATPSLVYCVNTGKGGAGVICNGASAPQIHGGRLTSSGAVAGIVVNDSAAPMFAGLDLKTFPLVGRVSSVVTATTSVAASGQVYSVGINVATAGAAGATIKLGTTAGASDILPATLIDSVGVKSPTLGTQPLGSGTIHITIAGGGAPSLTLNLLTIDNSATAQPVVINSVGAVVIDGCTIVSGANADVITLNATAAAAAKLRISNSTLRASRSTTTTKAAINAAAAGTLIIDNCVLDAPVALVNVTCAAPTATLGSNTHR